MREKRVPRSARPANDKPRFKPVEAIVREAIASGRDITAVVNELQERLVIVVRTDKPANMA